MNALMKNLQKQTTQHFMHLQASALELTSSKNQPTLCTPPGGVELTSRRFIFPLSSPILSVIFWDFLSLMIVVEHVQYSDCAVLLLVYLFPPP